MTCTAHIGQKHKAHGWLSNEHFNKNLNISHTLSNKNSEFYIDWRYIQ